jgi:hypothetical protein
MGSARPRADLIRFGQSKLITAPIFSSDDLLAAGRPRAQPFHVDAQATEKVLDLTAKSGVQTRQPPISFDHEYRSKELNQ